MTLRSTLNRALMAVVVVVLSWMGLAGVHSLMAGYVILEAECKTGNVCDTTICSIVNGPVHCFAYSCSQVEVSLQKLYCQHKDGGPGCEVLGEESESCGGGTRSCQSWKCVRGPGPNFACGIDQDGGSGRCRCKTGGSDINMIHWAKECADL